VFFFGNGNMKSRIFHYLIYVTFLIGIPTDAMSLGYDTKENIDGIFYRLFSPKVANYYKEYEAYVTTPEEGNYSGDIMIPSTVTFDGDTYTVTKIGSYAFCYDSEVTSITIPHTVNEIGTNAFLDCQGLSRLKNTKQASCSQTYC
jgi:hypothetical protein